MTLCLEKKLENLISHSKSNSAIPKHIAFIMDGNRRWARQRGLPPQVGHWKGAETIDRIVKVCKEIGVKTITLFAFSTENWNRSEEEVTTLFDLFASYLKKKKSSMVKEGVRLSTIGELSAFPDFLQKKLLDVTEATAECSAIELVLALNYGSRNEITRAVKSIIEDIEHKKIIKQQVTENLISSYLDTFRWEDPDLLIRTSGEKRLSNFLLWQLSYTEVHITQVLWPDFGKKELLSAIEEYQKRERRFGE